MTPHPGKQALSAILAGENFTPADFIAIAEYVEGLETALEQIQQWAEAYPETAFTTPDFDKMREVLKAAGMPTALDAAHGTWGRHIAEGVGKIARTALNTEDKSDG